jgi:septal ring factor EnvC (AmiA/AmiB activator)
MKRWKSLLILGTAAGWLFSVESASPRTIWADPVDKDLSQRRRDLKEIRKELSRTKEKEKKIQGKETSVLGNLQRLDNDLYRREKELNQIERKLDQTKERLEHNRVQVSGITERMEKTKEELSLRLVALYRMERTSPEALLLSSHSTLDLLKMDRFLKAVIHYDSNLVETYRQQVALKERYQAGLNQDRAQWERNISELEEKKREMERVRKSKQALLESIRSEKIVTRKVIQELEERVKELQALINKLERQKSVLAYGRLNHDALKGKLIPPVQGKVISLFKEKGQNGIEIKAPMGSEIRAVLPGKVLYSDWFKGFGNMVIIDHGDHTFTVSGYASDLLKKEGDLVSQGETIALVGSAGSLKGACLYFEIRHRGKPQDPLYWLSVPEASKAERK